MFDETETNEEQTSQENVQSSEEPKAGYAEFQAKIDSLTATVEKLQESVSKFGNITASMIRAGANLNDGKNVTQQKQQEEKYIPLAEMDFFPTKKG